MMGHKHLHELLREDQEPFQLKNFIADRRCRLSTTTTSASLQLRKRKPIINHVCLFSFPDSPDVRKSPLFNFPSPATKSPNNNAVFLHVPARTAAMLLEAAMRVQKQPTSSKPKTEPSKTAGFGLFGSFLRRLKDRSTRTKRHEIASSPPPARRSRKKKVVNDVVPAMDVDGSRRNSLDLETSCSSRSINGGEEIEFVDLQRNDDVFASCEKCFCSSPSSPFRFSLQKSPLPGRRTPEFLSPATSPSRHFQEENEIYEEAGSQEIHVEEEEEKEQFSPVSVLDPLFDDDGDEEHDCGVEQEHGYDIECSYANVQRAKHQLLQKLRRFERLAELNPIELEKHMLEQIDDDDDDDDDGEPEEQEQAEDEEQHFIREIVNYLGINKLPSHMKRLVRDLIAEENANEEQEMVAKRVCRRLCSWKMVESNTIDMMVEFDFRKEKSQGWKSYDCEKIREVGMDIEVAIFGLLMEELAQELVISYEH